MAYRIEGMRKTFKTEQDAKAFVRDHWTEGKFKLFGGTQEVKNKPGMVYLMAMIHFKTDRNCDPEMVCEFGLGADMVSIYPFAVNRSDLLARGYEV